MSDGAVRVEVTDAPIRPLTDGAGPASWMQGFHGVVFDLDGQGSGSLRQLALSRRSTGMLRLARLVELPTEASSRVVPCTSGGARSAARPIGTLAPPALGSVPAASPTASGAAVVPYRPRSDPLQAPVSVEALPAYLDRRLGEARYLLLPNRSRMYAVSKRAVDLLAAVLLLLLTAPVVLTLVVLIRLDSPGPALFCQERVTRGGRVFRFYKFRTMYVDARERFPELYDYRMRPEEFGSAYYKLVDDPRNTRVGKWLRRTTLDELPNLLNVLKGDLSMVGPRPDLPEFVRLYRPEELACLFTKAGLTGVAQVSGRSLLTVSERLTLDLRYVAQQTLLLDLRILWRTVVVVLTGRGAF